jgi:hypothetical protein
MGLGSYPAISLALARVLAANARTVATGGNPIEAGAPGGREARSQKANVRPMDEVVILGAGVAGAL